MQALFLLLLGVSAGPEYDVAAHDAPRRWVLVEAPLPGGLKAPLHVTADGKKLAAQVEGKTVRWLVPSIPAGKAPHFALMEGDAGGSKVELKEGDGWIGVHVGGREVTRYHHGAWAKEHKKPFWYPLTVEGVNLTRSWPMEPGRKGEAEDHPHHTAVYHTHDDTNHMNFWSKRDPIVPKGIVTKTSGPVYARIVAKHAWGPDLVETQDVLILNAGDGVVMDWTITMAAENGPVTFGKTKEGGFAVRVTTGLTNKNGGKVRMVDALGNEGEPAIRKKAASWVDYSGMVDGKHVGVAIMDHPTSFRYPTNWHVRGYGCFAANRYYVRGEHTVAKGDSIVHRYRLYAHAGDEKKAEVAAVWAGFAHAKVK